MNSKNSCITYLTIILLLPILISSQTCQKTCGNLPIHYPFGTGPGCGDQRFHPYITCTANQQLTFTTHTGCYTITTIDYTNQIITISDPTISTCTCTQPSKGFALDPTAPFSFHDSTVFALLDCSTSSPIYDNATTTLTMCDSQGESICSLLDSCDQPISRLGSGLQIHTCCVYAPVDLGPSFDIDLEKLRCSSYSALYGLNNPEGWKYGIALQYKFNFKNDYPGLCASCERSGGVCGYDDSTYKLFACNCPGGFNTRTDCFYESYGSRFLPWKIGTVSVFCFTWLVILAFM